MDTGQYSKISNYIWTLADDALRNVYVRGKYRDVILPLTVIRRLDAVLEPTKQAVLDQKKVFDEIGMQNQREGLKTASQQAFYNTSKFNLKDLLSISNSQQLKADFEDYLDGFSDNVQDIIDNFDFRHQIPKLHDAQIIGTLLDRLFNPSINLSPNPVTDEEGNVVIPGLDNHGMGTIFEDLIRRFNEDNNEEAGEHWTPRDAVKLAAKLALEPVAEDIKPGSYMIYDGCCGTGGMLTLAEETLQEIGQSHGKKIKTHIHGQEISSETYAICKADLLIKGEGEDADNIFGGPKYSTLTNDAFSDRKFDFMLSNPPYGLSWAGDQEKLGGKKGMTDSRFVVEHDGDPEFSLSPRSSDGQLLFMANMVSKMKHNTEMGSRIVTVHNGSSLFTGDAGSGESNTRRWIIENDWLEAIVALPLNMFYNTGIATYIWVLSNRKASHRKGKVQFIDATKWFKPLRKSLGQKNCEMTDEDIALIMETLKDFENTEQSIVLPNKALGYTKITVEHPLRLKVELDGERRKAFRELCIERKEEAIADLVDVLESRIGVGPHLDYNFFLHSLQELAKIEKVKLPAAVIKRIKEAFAIESEEAKPVIRKIHKPNTIVADPIHGLFEDEQNRVVEYEPSSSLRDTEQISLVEEGGIEAFFKREVSEYAPMAWINPLGAKVGYEINFNRYFYKALSFVVFKKYAKIFWH